MVLLSYRAYHFKDEHRYFDFVCITQLDFGNHVNNEYRIMYINYYNDLSNNRNDKPSHVYGEIDGWIMVLSYVSNIDNKTKRIKNAIRLAKLITA